MGFNSGFKGLKFFLIARVTAAELAQKAPTAQRWLH